LWTYTPIVAPIAMKFGTVPFFVPNFTPIGATCRPCRAKNLSWYRF